MDGEVLRFCDLEAEIGVLPQCWDDVEATPHTWKVWKPRYTPSLDEIAAAYPDHK